MAHLNIYLSKEREKALRAGLEAIAREQNRSISYIVEEALVSYVKQEGRPIASEKRKDHRSRATQ